MRASRILSTRPDRAMFALAQLCEDRGEDIPRSASRRPPVRHYPPSDTSRAHSTGAPSPTTDNRPYIPHRLSNASLASTASTSKSAQSGSEGTTTTTTLSTPISISHPNGTPIILPTPAHLQQHSQSQPPIQPQAQQLQPPPQKPQLVSIDRFGTECSRSSVHPQLCASPNSVQVRQYDSTTAYGPSPIQMDQTTIRTRFTDSPIVLRRALR
jgi:hypothetical protein